MKKFGVWIATFLVLLQAGMTVLWDRFYAFSFSANYTAQMIVIAFYFVIAGCTAFFYGLLKKRSVVKNVVISVLSAGACPGIAFLLGTYLLESVALLSKTTTSYVVIALASVYTLVYYVLQLIALKDASVPVKIVSGVLAGLFILSEAIMPVGYGLQYGYKVPTVTGLSRYTSREYKTVENADVYVATDGSDESGNGTIGNPYKTIGKAKEVVSLMDRSNRSGITVAIKAGEYRVGSMEFGAEDGGTSACPVTYCAYGDGEVVLNGGVTLRPGDFTSIPEGEMKNRLHKKVRDKVVCLDLSSYGIDKDDYGKIYAIGSYNTAAKYDGDYVGPIYSELFFNDTRMNLARYPDKGFLKTGRVVKMGKGLESDGSKTARPDYWATVRNPQSDVYALSAALTDRIASWKTLDDVWMFGFFKYTWADASSPIGEFNKQKKTLSPKFVSIYGAIQDAPYYFFNVFEELDAPGEWYLDRESGVLYMYPLSDMSSATIDLSLAVDPVVTAKTNDLHFVNVTFKGTRGDGVVMEGNNNSVELCSIKNVSGNALLMKGFDNRATENVITHTGKGGISLDGGDREGLLPGGNVADNNLIHDFSEIYLTYQPAVTLSGVGNVCSHNEIYNSPHEAVAFYGNDHLIEYNNIHDVCLLSDDAGAIYSGRHWDWYGNVIQYNAVYDLGSGEHYPCGIYMDDALSGQTIRGNLLVNVPNVGIELGGGRDLIVQNNVIINSNYSSISYDARAREGVTVNGWFDHSTQKDGDMWVELYSSPWKTEKWQERYPQYARYSDDFSDTENKDFVPNPSYSDVSKNVCVNLYNKLGDVNKDVYRFSNVADNLTFFLSSCSLLFNNWEKGDYTLKENSSIYKKIPDFEPIPISKIGRY